MSSSTLATPPVADVEAEIARILDRMIAEKGETAPTIGGDTVLLGGTLPIDSLDLAVLVTELEQKTGQDPFADGFIHFQTVRELARLYRG
jgi:acyl carrier protein